MRALRVLVLAGLIGSGISPAPVGAAGNPNAGKIAFESDRASEAVALYAMRPDGTGVVALNAPPGAADASWSPDGHRLAFEAAPAGSFDPEIFVMDADGTDVRQLTDSPGLDIWPDWFPDGRQIVFNSFRTGKPDIYVMNTDGSGIRQLTDDPLAAAFHPQVSPNGRHILYTRDAADGTGSIYVMDADGSAKRALTSGPFADRDAVWSPSGKQIVFSSNRNGFSVEIFIMDTDGSNIRALTNTPGADYAPAVSPDGKQIAWTKRRSGNDDVWVMNIDGSGQTQLTFGLSFDGFPDWHQGHL